MLNSDPKLTPQAKIQHDALIYFIKNRYESFALLQLESMPSALVEYNNNSALQWACQEGVEKVVDALLEKITISSNIEGISRALGIASQLGHCEILKSLVNKGIDPSSNDNYALRYASKNGHLETVTYLLSISAVSNNAAALSNAALDAACKKGHTEIVKLLLNITSVQDSLGYQGRYPELYWALRAGHYLTALALLTCYNANNKISLEKKEAIFEEFKSDLKWETSLNFEDFLYQQAFPPEAETFYSAPLVHTTCGVMPISSEVAGPSTSSELNIADESFLNIFQRNGITDFWPVLETAISSKAEIQAIRIIRECIESKLNLDSKLHGIIELALDKRCSNILIFLCQNGWGLQTVKAAMRRGNETTVIELLNQDRVIYDVRQEVNDILTLAVERNQTKVIQFLLGSINIGAENWDQEHMALRAAFRNGYLNIAKRVLEYYEANNLIISDEEIIAECFDLFFTALRRFKGQKYNDGNYDAWIKTYSENKKNFNDIASVLFLISPSDHIRTMYNAQYLQLRDIMIDKGRMIIVNKEVITREVEIKATLYPATLLFNKKDPFGMYGQLLSAIIGRVTQDAQVYAAYLIEHYGSHIIANIELILKLTIQTGSNPFLKFLLSYRAIRSEACQRILNKMFVYAAEINNYDCLELLIKRGNVPVSFGNNAALGFACLNANERMTAFLLENYEGNDIEDPNNRILRNAVMGGSANIVVMLFDKFKPILANQVADNNNEMLRRASRLGKLEIVVYLLSYVNVMNLVAVNDNEALFLAARAGHLHIVETLLQCQPVLEKISSHHHRALRAALEEKRYKVAKAFFEKYETDEINITYHDFQTIFSSFLKGLAKLSRNDINQADTILDIYQILFKKAKKLQYSVELKDQFIKELKDCTYESVSGVQEHIFTFIPDLMKVIDPFCYSTPHRTRHVVEVEAKPWGPAITPQFGSGTSEACTSNSYEHVPLPPSSSNSHHFRN